MGPERSDFKSNKCKNNIKSDLLSICVISLGIKHLVTRMDLQNIETIETQRIPIAMKARRD